MYIEIEKLKRRNRELTEQVTALQRTILFLDKRVSALEGEKEPEEFEFLKEFIIKNILKKLDPPQGFNIDIIAPDTSNFGMAVPFYDCKLQINGNSLQGYYNVDYKKMWGLELDFAHDASWSYFNLDQLKKWVSVAEIY